MKKRKQCLSIWPLLPILFVCMVEMPSTQELARIHPNRGLVKDAASLIEIGRAWLVPQSGGRIPMPTIQEAVDAAQDGDTILLSNGVFRGAGNRDLKVVGKNVVIRSRGDASRCVVDCQNLARGILFEGDAVTHETLFYGITIRNGDPFLDPTYGYGGGVLAVSGAHPTIKSSIFESCEQHGVRYAYGNQGIRPPGVVQDCLFLNNRGGGFGGGLWGANVIVEECTFVANSAVLFGGGIRIENTVRNCLIIGNFTTATTSGGGGVYAVQDAVVENCTIVGNQALSAGGSGGGIILDPASPVVSNCILRGNSATQEGQQIFQAGPVIGGSTNAVIRYCNIEGGANGVETSFLLVNEPTLENILEADPLFVNASAGDYHLRPDSPCIEAGDPGTGVTPNLADIDRQPRIGGMRVDLGSDEAWSGFVLGLPAPGVAGLYNSILATGATPGAWVVFFYGLTPGALPFSSGVCPSLELAIADAMLLGPAVFSASGTAMFGQHVQPMASGLTIYLQAVALTPGVGCAPSNLVAFSYP